MGRVTTKLRAAGNGIVVVIGLLVTLPAVVLAERVRRGAGRTVAARAIAVIAATCGIRFRVVGAAHLTTSAGGRGVVVANHASPLDIPALLAAHAELRFVAAAELFGIPLLGSAMRALDAVPVDRRRARASGSKLEAEGIPRPTVVFAEGGIPVAGDEPRFHTGAFVLAIESGAPVVPVTIHGSARVLPRGSRIWARPGTVTVEVHAPIETTGLSLADRKALRDRTELVVRDALRRGMPEIDLEPDAPRG